LDAFYIPVTKESSSRRKAVQKTLDYAQSLENKVVLIYGMRLAQLMTEHNLGVSSVTAYEMKRTNPDYFVED
jgi:restriction system protein